MIDTFSYCSLHLSNSEEGNHEDVELLLGSYSADLDEILTEIKIFIDMIEDTDQFISAHLDSVRNEIIKMIVAFQFAEKGYQGCLDSLQSLK